MTKMSSWTSDSEMNLHCPTCNKTTVFSMNWEMGEDGPGSDSMSGECSVCEQQVEREIKIITKWDYENHGVYGNWVNKDGRTPGWDVG